MATLADAVEELGKMQNPEASGSEQRRLGAVRLKRRLMGLCGRTRSVGYARFEEILKELGLDLGRIEKRGKKYFNLSPTRKRQLYVERTPLEFRFHIGYIG